MANNCAMINQNPHIKTVVKLRKKKGELKVPMNQNFNAGVL